MYNLIEIETVNSTNIFAKENIEKLKDKTVISAEQQTHGYGRFQRKWISNIPENIYCSIILKPENKKHLINLTQYLCVVLCKTMEDYKVKPQIKWPNDVIVSNRKIAGILCEKSGANGFVLGIGVNLNIPASALKEITQPATSLNLETGQKINKKQFQEKLLHNFFQNYDAFIEKGFGFIKEDYIARIKFIGKKIYISNEKNKKIEYIAKSINDDGSLLVLNQEKKELKIITGDISLQ